MMISMKWVRGSWQLSQVVCGRQSSDGTGLFNARPSVNTTGNGT